MKLFNQLKNNSLSDEAIWSLFLKLDKKIKTRRICANTTLLTGTALFYLYAIFLIYSLVSPLLIFMFFPEEWGHTFLHTISIQNLFLFPPLPWYVTLLLIPAGLFALPWLIAAVVEGIAFLLCQILIPVKKTVLPEKQKERNETLARKAKELYHKQYNSTGMNISFWPNYIASALFGVLPVAYIFLYPNTRSALVGLIHHFSAHIPEIIGWILVFIIFIIVFGIPSFIFSYFMLTLDLAFDKIFRPLYWGRNWHPKCRALEDIEKTLYRRWIAVDPEERKKDTDRKKREQEEWERKQKFKEEFRKTMAGVYLKEQKERENDLKRLHEWVNDDDGIDWRGKGDGI